MLRYLVEWGSISEEGEYKRIRAIQRDTLDDAVELAYSALERGIYDRVCITPFNTEALGVFRRIGAIASKLERREIGREKILDD